MEKATLQWVKTDEIRIPERRLRSRFNNSKAQFFKSSMKTEGILQPIQVVEDEKGIKWLVDGQNRLEEWVKEGHSIVPVIIKKGSKIDAVLGSAQHNLLRGKVNSAELSEFMAYLHNDLRLSYEKICKKLHLSKGYVSLLVNLASNKELLEKVRKREISLKEARKKLSGSTVEPISSEKPSFTESVQKQAFLEKPKQEEISPKGGLEDEELGVTNLKEVLEKGKPEMEKEKEREADVRHLKCLVCGLGFRLGEKPAWIPVHRHEKSLAFDILEKARAERESHNGSSQP